MKKDGGGFVKARVTQMRVHEISSVDRPAQPGALQLIQKRFEGDGVESDLDKGYGYGGYDESASRPVALTDDVKGHAHLIYLDDGAGSTTTNVMQTASKDDSGYHSHPYIVDEKGAVTIGEARGHSHKVRIQKADDEEFDDLTKAAKTEDGQSYPASDFAYVPDVAKPSSWKLRLTSKPGGPVDAKIVGAAVAALGQGFNGRKVVLPADARPQVVARVRAAWKKANPSKSAADIPAILKSMENKMTTEEQAALEKKVADGEKLAKRGAALDSLSAEEFTFYKSLQQESEREGFLAKSSEDRAAARASAAEADPVVYTTTSGRKLRKSAGEDVIASAKESDELRKSLQDRDARLEKAELEKRAEVELPHTPGTVEVRAALLKAVESIKDEKVRKEALGVLKSNDEKLAKLFKRAGTTGDSSGESAEDRFEKLAKRYSSENKVSLNEAMVAISRTPEGQSLYAESLT